MLKGAAKSIAIDLRQLADKELGIHVVQEVFNSIRGQHNIKNSDEDKYLKKLSKKIEEKVSSVLSALNETVLMIEEYGSRGGSKIHIDCSGLFTNGASSDCEISQNSSLINITSDCSTLNISEVFLMHQENFAAIKNEYFLPAGDDYRTCLSDTMSRICTSVYNDYCQPLNDPYFEQIYLKSMDHNPRQIVLLIDHGSSVGYNQLAVAKSLAKYIVTALGHGDQICIIGLSETAVTSCDEGISCESSKHHLLNFIDSLNKSKGLTNHSLGFELSFDLINNAMQNTSSEIYTTILYISKGLLPSLTEAKTVLEVIAAGQKTVFPRVIINTCALIDDWKPVIYEKHFLRDIAQQNFYKYNISFNEPLLAGIMEVISVGSNPLLHTTLGPLVRRLMGSLNIDDHINERVNFFLPQLDEIRTDPVITISRVVQVKYSGIIGVAAIQVFLEDIVEDVIYFNNNINSYAFLINTEGYVLTHPSLRQVGYYVEQPWVIDISLLEIVENISVIRTSVLKEDCGELITKRKSDGKLIEYSWQRLGNAPYIVIVTSEMNRQQKQFSSLPQLDRVTAQTDICSNNCDLVYNRLDYLLSGRYSLCRHINDLTTLDAGSLFLSASCFQSPFKYLLSDKNASYFNIQNYMAYIKDKTKLLANPGLKSGIRSEIISLSTILPYWKTQFFNSRLNKYIVRRYIATRSGIMIVYPGTHLHHRFDPIHCVWFTSAVNNPSRLMLTAPYPDTGDAGSVVTISQAFVSSSTGTTVVVAMDVTFGYLYVMLMDVLPYCSFERGDNSFIKCFIMDDRGYLLSHSSLSSPGLMDSNGKPPVEGQHITYKESLVAIDILNHKGLVEKLLCSDLLSGTVQRYYRFNTSVNRVISNIISGDQCVQYQLVAVPATNIFIAVVNTTCDTAFCPCSTIDRHCLNCDRMEQTACECPCECPVNMDCNIYKQNNNNNNSNNLIPPCTNHYETAAYQCSVTSTLPYHLHQNVHHTLMSKVKSCSIHECHKYLTHRSCLGVVGCEWCHLQSDGATHLINPFCTVQQLCFNGVLGSNMPFGERTIHGSSMKDGSGLHSKSSSTGAIPMGGAVIALLFALLLMCYCYHKRSQMSQLSRHDHNCTRPVSLFALEKNNNNRIIEEPPTEPHNGLLQSAQEVSVALLTPVSPYLMNTGYCRPATGDSDHGYSTMTPHEDTDHLEVEPPVPVQQTLLSHHILAPVTVHMVMDT